MTLSKKQTVLHFALLLFGVLSGATAVIMIKASTEHPFLVASYRLLVAAIVLTPLFYRDTRLNPCLFGWQQVRWAAVPALCLAIHFMSWTAGARMTQVANASLIANLTAVVMPFFIWVIFHERITRQEIFGSLFTLAGLAVLTGSSLRVSNTGITGDLICFGSMLCFALYLALGRKNGQRVTLWMYMVPLYWMAGLICLGSALFFVNPIKAYTLPNVLYILGLGLVPTTLSHTILNYSLKFFRGQVVSVTNLSQPIFATLMGLVFFGERPSPVFLIASVLILAGILVVLSAKYAEKA